VAALQLTVNTAEISGRVLAGFVSDNVSQVTGHVWYN